MQTFLPYQDFAKCAKVLDRQRLGKQRLECLQILNALTGKSKGWVNHPCVKMWKSFEVCLAEYGWYICSEWIRRGYKDTCMEKIIKCVGVDMFSSTHPSPPWLSNDKLFSSHRAALLAKNYEWYKQFNWTEEPIINYVWPVK